MAAIWLAWTLLAQAAPPEAGDRSHVQLMVKFKTGADAAQRKALHERLGGKLLKTLRGAPSIDVVAFAKQGDPAALIQAYERSGLVEYAELDAVVRAEGNKPPP